MCRWIRFQNRIKCFRDTLILWILFLIMKINDFEGDGSDTSANKKNTAVYVYSIDLTRMAQKSSSSAQTIPEASPRSSTATTRRPTRAYLQRWGGLQRSNRGGRSRQQHTWRDRGHITSTCLSLSRMCGLKKHRTHLMTGLFAHPAATAILGVRRHSSDLFSN